MFATINKELKTPKGISEIPFNTLAEDIQSVVYRYSTQYNLLTSGNVKVSSNDFYFFIYVKDIYENVHRIDIEL